MAPQCEGYMVERDAARDKPAQAERALWHAQAARASNGERLINTNIRLVLTLIDTSVGGAGLPPARVVGGDELGGLVQPWITPRRGEDGITSVLDHGDSAPAEAPLLPANQFEDDQSVSAIFARDPFAHITPLFDGGEPPATDDEDPPPPPRRPVILEFPPAPPISISSGSSPSRGAREQPSFEPYFPRPAGASSPSTSHRSGAAFSSPASSSHGDQPDRARRRRRANP